MRAPSRWAQITTCVVGMSILDTSLMPVPPESISVGAQRAPEQVPSAITDIMGTKDVGGGEMPLQATCILIPILVGPPHLLSLPAWCHIRGQWLSGSGPKPKFKLLPGFSTTYLTHSHPHDPGTNRNEDQQ